MRDAIIEKRWVKGFGYRTYWVGDYTLEITPPDKETLNRELYEAGLRYRKSQKWYRKLRKFFGRF